MGLQVLTKWELLTSEGEVLLRIWCDCYTYWAHRCWGGHKAHTGGKGLWNRCHLFIVHAHSPWYRRRGHPQVCQRSSVYSHSTKQTFPGRLCFWNVKMCVTANCLPFRNHPPTQETNSPPAKKTLKMLYSGVPRKLHRQHRSVGFYGSLHMTSLQWPGLCKLLEKNSFILGSQITAEVLMSQVDRGFLSKIFQWAFSPLGIPNGCKSVSKKEK